MTISKTLAENIAKKLCSKKYNEYQKSVTEKDTTIEKVYIKKIPKDVMAFFNKNPKMIISTSSICINGGGFHYYHATLSKRLPEISRINDELFTQTEKDAFLKLKNKVDLLKREYTDLLQEVTNALLNLKTTKRIAEHFPEAIQYLPTSEKLELAINITDIRNKIK